MLTMNKGLFLLGACLLLASAAGAQDKGKIIEEVVARVNGEAITRGDLERSRAQIADEVTKAVPPAAPTNCNNDPRIRKRTCCVT